MKNTQATISPEFSQFTSRFQEGLSFYKLQLDKQDQKLEKGLRSGEILSMQPLSWEIGKEFYNFLTDSMEDLKQLTQDYVKRQNEVSGTFLRQSIFPFILESPFLKRTNLRPQGYPGDATMMEMIYQNEYLGESSFGNIFHKHPIETKAADAVRNRRAYLERLIQKQIQNNCRQDFKILSVACGPAWEVGDFFLSSQYKELAQFYLLDQDAQALAQAKKRIGNIQNGKFLEQCHFLQESVRVILKNPSSLSSLGKFDFIYSMGLYDYLSLGIAKMLTEKLYSMLKENGVLVIGNYHKGNETRNYMEYVMDWILYYRNESEVMEFTRDLAKPNSIQIEFENSKCQMFLKIEK